MNADEFDEAFSSAPPGCAPGGILFKTVAWDGTVLVERAVTPPMPDDLDRMAEEDADVARAYVDAHGVVVACYAYDGDTGTCVTTLKVDP